MKTFLLLATFCALTLPALAGSKDEVHTPDKGSVERSAILEAVHAQYARNDPDRTAATVEFTVPYLKVHNGWAWIEIHPRMKDGSQAFEPQSELYRLKDGKWTFMDSLSGEADADHPKEIREMKKKFPGLPEDILPKVQ